MQTVTKNHCVIRMRFCKVVLEWLQKLATTLNNHNNIIQLSVMLVYACISENTYIGALFVKISTWVNLYVYRDKMSNFFQIMHIPGQTQKIQVEIHFTCFEING